MTTSSFSHTPPVLIFDPVGKLGSLTSTLAEDGYRTFFVQSAADLSPDLVQGSAPALIADLSANDEGDTLQAFYEIKTRAERFDLLVLVTKGGEIEAQHTVAVLNALCHTRRAEQASAEQTQIGPGAAGGSAGLEEAAAQRQSDQQKIRQFQALYDATQVIIDAIEEGDIYARLLEQAIALTGANGEKAFMATIQLYNSAEEMLVLNDVYPTSVENELEYSLGYSRAVISHGDGQKGVLKQTLLQPRPLLISDIDGQAGYVRFHNETRCMIVTPLIHDGQPRGLMTVAHRQPNGLMESDCSALEMLARQAMLALEKVDYISEIEARSRLVWWNVAAGVAGHSMKNRVLTIRNRAEALLTLATNTITPKEQVHIHSHTAAILNACQRVIGEKFDLGSLHDNMKILSPRHIHVLVWSRIQAHISIVATPFDTEEHFQNSLQTESGVRVNEGFLNHALDIIVENAIHAMQQMPVEQAKKFVVTTVTERNTLQINLRDSGPGVPSDVQKGMFRKVIQSDSGNGVGLLVANEIVSAYKGKIELSDTGTSGTTVTITLPLVETNSRDE